MEPDFFDFETLREDYDVEFKTGEGKDQKGKLPKSFWETYSAMANTEGGLIFFGIKELKPDKFLPVGIKEPEKVIKELWNGLNNPEKVSINILCNADVILFKHENKQLICVKIPQADRKQRPIFINNNPLKGTFRRNHDGDYHCSETIVKQMLGDQANDTRDAVLMEGFYIEDINLPTLQVFRQHFTNRKPNHPFNDYNDKEFLRQIGGLRTNRGTKKESLTLAGLLMFGKLRSILDGVPNYIVDYQEQPRIISEKRWIDRVTTDFTWSGNLYDFYRFVIVKLCEELKVPFQLSGDQRIEDTPVHEALREALVNTIIHADYSGSCSILAVKKPDLFEFRNPGLLRIPRIDILRGGISDCRNRNLQKMFQLLGLGEQAGSGFSKIYKNWKQQHWKDPDLEEKYESNQTILVLRMSSLFPKEIVDFLQDSMGKQFNSLNQIERIALVTAKAEGCVTHRRLIELTKDHPSELTKVLHGLVDKKILVSEGSGKGTFYYIKGEHPMLNKATNNKDTYSEHLNENSEHLNENSEHLNENSEHLNKLKKISENIRNTKKISKNVLKETIISLCTICPLSMTELASLLKRKENSIRNHYINPMCDDGILERKYPNIIRHPRQKYSAVKKSKKELN